MGKLARDLLLQQKFYGTVLPRVPVATAKEIEDKVRSYDSQNSNTHDAKDKDEEDDDSEAEIEARYTIFILYRKDGAINIFMAA
jgi:hypothetical protein